MTFSPLGLAFALGESVLALGSGREAAGAEDLGPTVELKPGQEIAFPVAIVGGHVTPGKALLLKLGATLPKDSEIWSGQRRQARFLALCRPDGK